MSRSLIILVIVYSIGLASATPTYTYFYPAEHRAVTSLNDEVPIEMNNYELQVIPNDQMEIADTSVSEYDDTFVFSVLDLAWGLIPSPIADIVSFGFKAIAVIGSKALAMFKFVFGKAIWVALGMAIVVGFCAFTPYCTLIIEKPFVHELQHIPYINEVESFLNAAYEKYEYLQL